MARKWFVFLCYLQTFLRLQHLYPHSLADPEVMEFLGKGKRQQEEKGHFPGSRGEDYLSWVKVGFGITTQLLGVLIITNTTCAGQIAPDTTLGTESSQVNSHVMIRGLEGDRIDGGAVRGSALFHSFSEFNVNDGQRVYFSNPAGITNIFTRVTGTNLSHILGTLGVDGGANLFLLNPQGIKFGSNAQLDIQGSFVASTANSFLFPDGSEFSAKNPKAPLLTMSVTPGVQWGASTSSGTITNEGNLTVGEDLTLSAGNLDLQGQLHALKDLTLFAQDTVKVRDSVTNPFIAFAGGNLTVQGNGGIDILALNHPTQTPFVSGSNLSFISDGKISLDAHFSSGGNFAISPVSGGLANWVSLYDPIISANGDVDVAASYTGTSLLVEATGNIRFRGNIEITGSDSNILPTGPDTETLTKNSALIVRSGQSTLAYEGVNSGNVPSYSNDSVPEGITLAGDVVLKPFDGIGGIVRLKAASGDVKTQLISTNGLKDDPYSFSYDANAIGGAISIEATKGSVNTGNLLSYSYSESGNVGNEGAIALTAGGNIETSSIYSYSFLGGNGGAIALTAGGNIKTSGIGSSSFLGGNGGAIALTAGGNIETSSIYSYSFLGGNGGAITLTAGGNIETSSIYSYSFLGGNGGAIALTAGGNITVKRDFNSFSYSKSGNSGTGGAIFLSAKNGDIVGTRFETYSYNDFLQNDVEKLRYPMLNSFSISKQGTAGKGGNVTIEAKNSVSNLDILTLSSSAKAGEVNVEGFGDLSLTNTKILTSGQLKVEIPKKQSIELDIGKAGQSGDVTIQSSGNLTFNNSRIDSDTINIASAGNVTIKSPGLVTFNNSQIIANTSAQGNGGNINITGDSVTVDSKGQLAVESKGTGSGGNISIHTRKLTIEDNAKISASAENTGKGGSINIQAATLKLNQGEIISESKQSEAGIIKLNLNNLLLLRHNSAISTSAGTQNSGGNGGNIEINLKDGFVIAVPSENSDIIANAFGGNGGTIDMRANRILGFQLQGQEALDKIRNNGSSDISASSDVGTQGQVTVENLNVDPSQGLVQLSTKLIDPTGLIASGCGGNSHLAKGQSEFVITGRGGLPPSPDDTLTAGTAPTTWVISKTQALSNSSNKRPVVKSNTVSSSETSAPLVEAQGMIRNANGEIILTAQPPVNTLYQSALPAQFCHLTQK
jgi:filamentous hemagglutinin family protein